MRLETVKTFILSILIGISLLLTFALWSYRPEMGNLTEDVVEDSTDLGGTEETMERLVEPGSIVFRNDGHYFGFADPTDQQSLYSDMQSWVMYNFRTTDSNGPPSEAYQVEFIFPDTIPMNMAGALFTFNEDVEWPDWGFERLFITFNQDTNALNVIFLSEDGEQQATAIVNNSEKYDRLWDDLTAYEGLTEFLEVEAADDPFYIPADEVDVATKSIAVQTIDSGAMVDIMFTNPDIVTRSQVSENEIYFTDSARGIMRVYPNRRTMEFQNPLQSSYAQMEPEALLTQSMTHINDHRGWTDDYHLRDIDVNAETNTVRYQLFYDGYPVFGSNYSTIIEQQYRAEELHQYNRPLYSLENYLGEDDSTTLRSGSQVLEYLDSSSTYDLADLEGIKIGYDLNYRSSADAITLEPAWFMNDNGSWQKIDFSAFDKAEERGD
ncbi:YycH family regulatory protein [Lentibacillus salinarum]|uniref:YycH family regulatory protein n=1 Tax=Lentibacillus salinarum TaxID=446820 RepID=A0ABW3ZY34_9BACI